MLYSNHSTDTIVIIGAGPVGMVLAYALSRLNIPCTLFETNQTHETTRFPKMDLTNSRVMDLFRLLGLADTYRNIEGAVSASEKFESIFMTSLSPDGRELGRWSVPSVDEQRAEIRDVNDGSYPAEPGQRCSQIVFEKWMRGLVLKEEAITFWGGWRYISHVEDDDQVQARFVDLAGKEHTVPGRYLVGCDGGRSVVRKNSGLGMVGGTVPARFYLVHFRSAALSNYLTTRKTRFWHAFPANSGFIIDQDGKDTFTAHYPLLPTLSATSPTPSPHEAIHKVLAGCCTDPFKFPIDTILAHSIWQPSFSIANSYISAYGRVLLAGDAAHRSPPHGGYGLNSGLVDAVDLSWRLAALSKGYGGEMLLKAYSIERRPMMMRALCRSYRHLMEHVRLAQLYQKDWEILNEISDKGRRAREETGRYIRQSGPDTTDKGIELDLRYEYSPCVVPDADGSSEDEVTWDVKRYVPSTKPGHRVPHVYLRDGKTSIYDLLGPEWTLIHFVNTIAGDEAKKKAGVLLDVAQRLNFPLKHVTLYDENHARKIWQRDIVLVRPDTHAAWRCNANAFPSTGEAEEILAVVSGRVARPDFKDAEPDSMTKSEEQKFLTVVATLGLKGDGDE
ncbi:FAD binding domain-containing protein [Aspergillus undulatus]|uniref:FAD binding domain-containing protein n=1 Tax=Aspergillus undulatus TaxID=1810928 RepID=UPI003CCCC966